MTMASKRTFYRILHESGYYFLQASQKGLVSGNDRKKRVKYAKEMKRHLSENPNFSKDDVAFYFDAVFGICYLLFAICNLQFAICNLVFGIWYLVFGIWYLVLGIWYLLLVFVLCYSHFEENKSN